MIGSYYPRTCQHAIADIPTLSQQQLPSAQLNNISWLSSPSQLMDSSLDLSNDVMSGFQLPPAVGVGGVSDLGSSSLLGVGVIDSLFAPAREASDSRSGSGSNGVGLSSFVRQIAE